MPRVHRLSTIINCLFQNRQCYHQARSTAPERTLCSETGSRTQHHRCKATALQTEGLPRSSGNQEHNQLLPRVFHSTVSSYNAPFLGTSWGARLYYTPGIASNSFGMSGVLLRAAIANRAANPGTLDGCHLEALHHKFLPFSHFIELIAKGCVKKKKKKGILTVHCKKAWKPQETNANAACITCPDTGATTVPVCLPREFWFALRSSRPSGAHQNEHRVIGEKTSQELRLFFFFKHKTQGHTITFAHKSKQYSGAVWLACYACRGREEGDEALGLTTDSTELGGSCLQKFKLPQHWEMHAWFTWPRGKDLLMETKEREAELTPW